MTDDLDFRREQRVASAATRPGTPRAWDSASKGFVFTSGLFVQLHAICTSSQIAQPLGDDRFAALGRGLLARGCFGILERHRLAVALEFVEVRAIVLRHLVLARLDASAEPLIEIGLDAEIVPRDLLDALIVESRRLR